MKNKEGTPSSNADPNIVLNVHWREGTDEQWATDLAEHMVYICLHENLITVPDTSKEEIEIKVYVEADGGVTVCYEEQRVSMMREVIAVTPADLIASSLLGIILGGFGGFGYFGDENNKGKDDTPVS